MGELEKEFEKILELAIPRIAIRLQNELVLRVPVDTGRLRASIKVVPYEGGIRIFMADYGIFVEFGRAPRTIKPRNKKALSFKKGGKTIVVKEVRQGAVRPNPFIRETLKTKLKTIIIEEIQRVIDKS